MNIQIFGTKKGFDTKKAERYFKERGIKYQFIDLIQKGMSKGELNNISQAVGGFQKLVDSNSKDKDTLALFWHLSDADKEEKLLLCQQLLLQPIVRNGRQATVGYHPEIWNLWD